MQTAQERQEALWSEERPTKHFPNLKLHHFIWKKEFPCAVQDNRLRSQQDGALSNVGRICHSWSKLVVTNHNSCLTWLGAANCPRSSILNIEDEHPDTKTYLFGSCVSFATYGMYFFSLSSASRWALEKSLRTRWRSAASFVSCRFLSSCKNDVWVMEK